MEVPVESSQSINAMTTRHFKADVDLRATNMHVTAMDDGLHLLSHCSISDRQ
jgi:hypothetical protein